MTPLERGVLRIWHEHALTRSRHRRAGALQSHPLAWRLLSAPCREAPGEGTTLPNNRFPTTRRGWVGLPTNPPLKRPQAKYCRKNAGSRNHHLIRVQKPARAALGLGAFEPASATRSSPSQCHLHIKHVAPPHLGLAALANEIQTSLFQGDRRASAPGALERCCPLPVPHGAVYPLQDFESEAKGVFLLLFFTVSCLYSHPLPVPPL